ncbi:MAG TPA: transketolase [Dehalococcoidia bacterium]|nr:transketolase [Chloroflexota bacterium]MDP5877388.1 transketolase [Dehalococcoidia bacterium]MDP6272579.1 transketolase [Dehalococcoidia bacterium]MDP7160049.1 transketolase [Dehalococcoidia bacterium]MDP7212333.1 transketolase [Dehalococcoidia bacterium]
MPTMRERFTAVTSELLDSDPNVALILAAIGVAQFKDTGVVDRHPNRVINVGIREQLQMGFAAGMAKEGFRPIAHSYAPFLVERPWEQIRLDFGHQGVSGILVSIGATYDEADWGRTHQAPEDVQLLAMLPDWRIHVPGHPDEVEAQLRAGVADDTNVYIRLSTQTNDRAYLAGGPGFSTIRTGSGDAPTVVAVGPMLDVVANATADLDLTLLYANTIRPFDGELLCSVLQAPEVVLVEPYLEGTSTAEVSGLLQATPHRVLSLGTSQQENRHYGTAAEHFAAHGLDEAGIRSSITEFLAQRVPA